ncbi:unnamed protein product [Musa acuminata subsp. burmannicoides]
MEGGPMDSLRDHSREGELRVEASDEAGEQACPAPGWPKGEALAELSPRWLAGLPSKKKIWEWERLLQGDPMDGRDLRGEARYRRHSVTDERDLHPLIDRAPNVMQYMYCFTDEEERVLDADGADKQRSLLLHTRGLLHKEKGASFAGGSGHDASNSQRNGVPSLEADLPWRPEPFEHLRQGEESITRRLSARESWRLGAVAGDELQGFIMHLAFSGGSTGAGADGGWQQQQLKAHGEGGRLQLRHDMLRALDRKGTLRGQPSAGDKMSKNIRAGRGHCFRLSLPSTS